MLFIISAIALLAVSANLLAPFIPFSAEKKLAAAFEKQMVAEGPQIEDSDLSRYLQSLAERLAEAQQLPEDMSITVHYINDDTVNAFATLGGHVFFFRGLLESVPNENALAMVMAHEIAHVKHRHPIKSLGRAVIIGTATAVVSSAVGGDIVSDVLGKTGLLTVLKFSREQEEQSDETALAAIARLYGHVGGSSTLFNVLKEAHKHETQAPEFFNSHPLTDNRLQNIAAMAKEQGWQLTGPLTPLPTDFSRWLQQNREAQ